MNRFWKTVFLTGLFVGTTDILYAFISSYIKSGKFAEKMFEYIAGGALGLERSMNGGQGAAFLGLFFHYFIAMSFTVLFFLLFTRIKFLSFNKYLVGLLYAVFVNLLMRFVILPMTPLPSQSFILSRVYIDWVLFGIVFGIPIAWNAYRYYATEESKSAKRESVDRSTKRSSWPEPGKPDT
jgi:hypothetical protein